MLGGASKCHAASASSLAHGCARLASHDRNMVRSSFARISSGGFSLLLSMALLLMVGGLLASDRALTQSAEALARVDAEQTQLAVTQAIGDALKAGATQADIAADSALRAIVMHH